ncbi:MAG: uracil-DNA glycosylase [Oscillospiraceae bacterium]|nr:uracil-DNA glycosylase [Oscillospiraceae bacterium]
MSGLPTAWDELLDRPFDRAPHRETLAAAEAAALRETVYPPREDWFAAFRLTPPARVRAVILGQDPYHEPGQAMGLAFSVRAGVKLPPSLRNIYRELEADLGVPAPQSGDLTPWAEQGVLLLNTVLTVAAGRADSHRRLGWQAFTDEVLAALLRLPQPVAFVLWGAPAQRAYAQATGNRQPATENLPCLQGRGTGLKAGGGVLSDNRPVPRLILQAPHPSPLSAYRGFFGSRPFSQINTFLTAHGEAPIRWSK